MKMKIGLLVLCTGMVIPDIAAQPGFLGRRQLVEAEYGLHLGSGLRTFGKTEQHFGLNYEKVSSAKASWLYGFSFGSCTLEKDELDVYESNVQFENDPVNSSYASYRIDDTMKYAFQEFRIQRRWYYADRGAVAPYGIFLGLEGSLSSARQTTGDLRFYEYYEGEHVRFEPVKSRRNYAACFSLVLGTRRIIARNFETSFSMSTGYSLFQTSKPSVLALEHPPLVNHMDYQESVMMRHLVFSKIFQIRIGVGYLF